jgi:hypothetical protein
MLMAWAAGHPRLRYARVGAFASVEELLDMGAFAGDEDVLAWTMALDDGRLNEERAFALPAGRRTRRLAVRVLKGVLCGMVKGNGIGRASAKPGSD